MSDHRLRFWTRTAPQALVVAVVVGWLVAVLPASGSSTLTGRLGGDFPAFYAAGSIVADGDIDQLYDFDRQRSEQTEVFDSGFLAFAYPSYVAATYAPLTNLTFRTAYLVHTLAALTAVGAAVWLARGFSDTARRYPWLVLALAMLSYPLLRAFLGGQNTAFGLIVIVGVWWLLDRGHDVAAGLVLSLMSYKPQFLLPLLGVLLLSRRGRAVAGTSVGVGLHYLAGALLSGWAWPVEWWSEAVRFSNIDQVVNGPRSISWRGLTDVLGIETLWIPMAGATVVWVTALAWRHGRRDIAGALAVTLPAMLLMAPHAMFYDAGLTLPSLLLLADRGRLHTATALWASSWSHLAATGLGTSPLIGVSLLTGVAAQRSLLR